MNLYAAIADVKDEYDRAEARFLPFRSAHEGYAVILEELDELWEEVKDNKSPDYQKRLYGEAVQVAAMGLRFLVDLCGNPGQFPECGP